MAYLSYFIIFFLSQSVLAVVIFYCLTHRDKLTQMDCMMICMVLGMFSGLITGTLYLIPTGDFLYGFIVGSLVGMGFGMIFGRLGGPLAMLEGLMAGPMGGMMGAMLGQMIRPYDIGVFMPFFIFVFLVTMSAVGYMVFEKTKTPADSAAVKSFLSRTAVAIVLVLAVISGMPFSIDGSASAGPSAAARSQAGSTGQTTKAVRKGDVQEVELVADKSTYSPTTIYAKENVPLVIKGRALQGAGCVSEIVFPDLGISKLMLQGQTTTIELGALKKGVYAYSCPMGMSAGKLVVGGP